MKSLLKNGEDRRFVKEQEGSGRQNNIFDNLFINGDDRRF